MGEEVRVISVPLHSFTFFHSCCVFILSYFFLASQIVLAGVRLVPVYLSFFFFKNNGRLAALALAQLNNPEAHLYFPLISQLTGVHI